MAARGISFIARKPLKQSETLGKHKRTYIDIDTFISANVSCLAVYRVLRDATLERLAARAGLLGPAAVLAAPDGRPGGGRGGVAGQAAVARLAPHRPAVGSGLTVRAGGRGAAAHRAAVQVRAVPFTGSGRMA